MKTEKITRPSQLKDGDRVNFKYNELVEFGRDVFTHYFDCKIRVMHDQSRCAELSKNKPIKLMSLNEVGSDDVSHYIENIERIIPEPKTETVNMKTEKNKITFEINDLLESINIDFKNKVVTTVYDDNNPPAKDKPKLSSFEEPKTEQVEDKKSNPDSIKTISGIEIRDGLIVSIPSNSEQLDNIEKTDKKRLFVFGVECDYNERVIELADQLATDLKPKDRYFTDGFTIAKNPYIDKDRIVFESHICLNTYSKGGWLPVNEYTANWCKASKKQRKEFKQIESSKKLFDIKCEAFDEIRNDNELMTMVNKFFPVDKNKINSILLMTRESAADLNYLKYVLNEFAINNEIVKDNFERFIQKIKFFSNMGIRKESVRFNFKRSR